MFHFPDGTFDSRPVVVAFLFVLPHLAASLGHRDLRGKKREAKSGASFPGPSRTAFLCAERTALAEGQVEVRLITAFATAQPDRHALPLGTGQCTGSIFAAKVES